MAKQTLYDLTLNLTANSAALTKGLNEANSKMASFKQNTENIGGQVIGAFTKMGLAVGGFAGIIKLGKEIINSTEGSADKLKETIGYLSGGFQGLSRTIMAGDWGDLIINIKNTAEATRDLIRAQDELGYIMASNTIKRGRLARELAEKKIEVVETTDPKLKAKLIEEAIIIQKSLTGVNVDQALDRLKIQEDFYKKLSGYDKGYSEFMITKIREIAGNWKYWFKEGSAGVQGLQLRLEALKSKEISLGTWRRDADNKAILVKSALTEAEKKEMHQLKLSLFVLQDFIKLQEGMKPDEFQNYMVMLGEYFQTIADGEQDLVKLNKQLTTTENKIEKLNKTIGREVPKKLVGLESLGVKPAKEKGSVAEPLFQKPPKEAMTQYQTFIENLGKTVLDLQNVFALMFLSIDEGFKGMLKTFTNMLKQMAAQIVAKAVVFGILKLFFPETDAAKDLDKFGKFIFKGIFGHASGTSFAPGGLSMIGEQGPELVNLPRGSQVFSNMQSKNMLNNMTIKLEGRLVGEGSDLIAIIDREIKIKKA